MHTCVAQRPRKPQLSDTINRLDEMIDTLSTAIPGAVADSVREVLGTGLAVAIRDAVREAVQEGVKEAVRVAMSEVATFAAEQVVPRPASVVTQSPSASTVKDRVGIWARVRVRIGRLRHWATRRVAPVVAHVALGWAVVKIVAGSTIRSPSAALTTAFTGAVAGFTGYVAGPVGGAILLGLAGGAITAIAAWAAPTVRLLVAWREE